jgi:hypothetical protein
LLDSCLSPDFHRETHSTPCGLNLVPNHKIVLTTQDSECILLLAHLKDARADRT